jgi:osmotically-inducible protein OsmY
MSPDQLAKLYRAESLMKAVEHQLREAAVPVVDLSVAADADGNVALSGVVPSQAVKLLAHQVAHSVGGVRQLLNGLTVV